jgi:hypothetical protein
VLLGLGGRDVENAVVEAGHDGILVDAGGEVESASKLADASLRDPVLGSVGRLLVLGRLGNIYLGLALCFSLILDSGFVRGLAFANGGLLGRVLEEASGWAAGGVDALRLAANHHDLRLREFDMDVFLVDTRELAVKFVGVASLADVKLGLPMGHLGATTAIVGLAGVGVKVVEETEERGEGGGVVVELGEEDHFERCERLLERLLERLRDCIKSSCSVVDVCSADEDCPGIVGVMSCFIHGSRCSIELSTTYECIIVA